LAAAFLPGNILSCVDRSEIAVPSNEEIKAARTVLTDDCIVDLKRGIAAAENVIKLMLEAAEKVRSAGANVRPAPADWNEPPVRPTDKRRLGIAPARPFGPT
jgi:hypothetical protein